VTATEAPSRASNSVTAAPMPDAPPVTSATLPATCPVISTPFFFESLIAIAEGSSDHRRPLFRHRDIEHPQLHALGALPAIDRERSATCNG